MQQFTAAGLKVKEGGDDYANELEASDYYKYELVGVLVHAGTAEAGHYYSYNKLRSDDTRRPIDSEREEDGLFYIFDDTRVERYDLIKNLELDCFGGRTSSLVWDAVQRKQIRRDYDRHNNAYMLLYERICKDAAPKEAAPEADGTCVMADATAASLGGMAGLAMADTPIGTDAASPSDGVSADQSVGPPELRYDVMVANLRFQHDQVRPAGSDAHKHHRPKLPRRRPAAC